MVYYNENNPFAAEWLRNLIAAGHLPGGEVDDRSIVDVEPSDLKGFRVCHFFAGIGGWAYSAQLAEWPTDHPMWTGSCPCQPFSVAGKGGAFDDPRHLWPAWFDLIKECHPPVIFGEQVAAAINRGWLDIVFADLEGEGYACGAAVLPACGVGAPHIRQRLWFVANAALGGRREKRQDGGRLTAGDRAQGIAPGFESGSDTRELCHATSDEQRRPRLTEACRGRPNKTRRSSPWRDLEWLACTDRKARPTKPGIYPLAHGIPGRVGRLRAYGNAIVPQVAAAIIKSVM